MGQPCIYLMCSVGSCECPARRYSPGSWLWVSSVYIIYIGSHKCLTRRYSPGCWLWVSLVYILCLGSCECPTRRYSPGSWLWVSLVYILCVGSCECPTRRYSPGCWLWVSSDGEPGHEGGKGRGRSKFYWRNITKTWMIIKIFLSCFLK